MLNQISVFLPNHPGTLADFTKTLMENKINMRAISTADTTDYGILRILVDKTEECLKVLKSKNFLVTVTDVIAVKVPDKPGGLYEIAAFLGENDVNIEYCYSTIIKEAAIIVLRIDDTAKAIKILKKKGIQLLEQHEL